MATQACLRPTVLIVDDDEAITRNFREMLRLRDFQVVVAADATSGLARAEERTPDAVVLDLHVSTDDGIALLRDLRVRPALAEVPVAIVTGDYLVDDAIVDEAARLGARIHFKPLWLDELVALVERLVSERAS